MVAASGLEERTFLRRFQKTTGMKNDRILSAAARRESQGTAAIQHPPPHNLTRRKVISIEVTSKGRLNLHKYDEALQAQLEGYLVDIGILAAGQTLVAQEAPPDTDDVVDSPLVEA